MNQIVWMGETTTIDHFILFENNLQFSILYKSNWNICKTVINLIYEKSYYVPINIKTKHIIE